MKMVDPYWNLPHFYDCAYAVVQVWYLYTTQKTLRSLLRRAKFNVQCTLAKYE